MKVSLSESRLLAGLGKKNEYWPSPRLWNMERDGRCEWVAQSPPREEGWLRHKEKAGEAHLSAADGVVARKACFGASDHPGRFASTPPHEEGNIEFGTIRNV